MKINYQKELLRILKSKLNEIKTIVDDMDKNSEKYPKNYYNGPQYYSYKNDEIIGEYRISIICYEDKINIAIVYLDSKTYDYNLTIVFNREDKKYENYIYFSREYKGRGNGYYAILDWNGKKIKDEYD